MEIITIHKNGTQKIFENFESETESLYQYDPRCYIYGVQGAGLYTAVILQGAKVNDSGDLEKDIVFLVCIRQETGKIGMDILTQGINVFSDSASEKGVVLYGNKNTIGFSVRYGSRVQFSEAVNGDSKLEMVRPTFVTAGFSFE